MGAAGSPRPVRVPLVAEGMGRRESIPLSFTTFEAPFSSAVFPDHARKIVFAPSGASVASFAISPGAPQTPNREGPRNLPKLYQAGRVLSLRLDASLRSHAPFRPILKRLRLSYRRERTREMVSPTPPRVRTKSRRLGVRAAPEKRLTGGEAMRRADFSRGGTRRGHAEDPLGIFSEKTRRIVGVRIIGTRIARRRDHGSEQHFQ
jgi:hypothetical protein